MDILKNKTVCFTGHRPEKLPDGGNVNSPAVKMIKSMLCAEINNAVNEGYDTFITGMQRGVDLWAGEAVMSAAAAKDLKLIAVLPYRDFGIGFTGEDKWIFGRITDLASETVIISERYTPSCIAMRNRFMVDNSSRIIAVIGEEKSGTGQTLNYAVRRGLQIRKIDLDGISPQSGYHQLTLL